MAVEFRDSVGWKVGNLYANLVVALVQKVGKRKTIRNSPSATYQAVVYVYSCTLSNVAKVDSPAVAFLQLSSREVYGAFINACSHQRACRVVEILPRLSGVEVVGLRDGWSSFGKRQFPVVESLDDRRSLFPFASYRKRSQLFVQSFIFVVESLQNDALARTKINQNAVATNFSSLTVASHRVEPHSGSHRNSQSGVGLDVVRSEVGYEVMMSLVVRATY